MDSGTPQARASPSGIRAAPLPGAVDPEVRPELVLARPSLPPDLGTQPLQLLLDALVAAIDVVDALDVGRAFRDQAGQHQAG